jgi:D-alanyl-D-alanine carboxypeptidase (penicillin-binding protein 5/6)
MRTAILATLLLLSSLAGAAVMPTPPAIGARAWLLSDFGSGQELASLHAEERIEPASLTKLMTAYLAFSALQDGRISLDRPLTVSVKAWKMEGSRMFLQSGKQVGVDDLLRGLIVQSGNDAAIVLAEGIAGSEDAFVAMMNREAVRLGLKDTQFANATGLGDARHYSTARDLLHLAEGLIRDYPQDYGRYYAQKEFSYNGISQPNRNRLLWLDPTVDGVKSGHTESAGYCLISSAHRGARRLLAVVLGASTDAARTQESLKLLNYGFQSFEAIKLYDRDQAVSQLKVYKGAEPTVKAGFPGDLVLSLPKGAAARLKVQLVSQQPLSAPIAEGQRIATLKVSIDDRSWGEYPVVALQAVAPAGLIGRLWDSLRLHLQ